MCAQVSKPHYKAIKFDSSKKWEGEVGKRVCILTPKYLNVVWGNDPRYWSLSKDDQGMVSGAAELKQILWLEVTGTVTLPRTMKEPAIRRCRISFKVSLTAESFGWSKAPVFLMVKVGRNGPYTWKRIRSLSHHYKDQKLKSCYTNGFKIPNEEIDDGPLEVEVDSKSYTLNELYLGLFEVWSGKWKGGLKIHKVCIEEVNIVDSKSKKQTL